jgi:outer membrane protein TolC
MKKAIFCLLGLIFVSVSAHAITWNEVMELGEKNSHDLVAAQKQLESSEWSYRKAYSTFLPQLSLNASYSESTVSTAETTKSYSDGISATENLFQGMADIYGVQSAYANLEFQRADFQGTKASVFFDLRSAYVNLMLAHKNIEVLQKILDQAKHNTKLIQLMYDSGKEDLGSLMSTRADEASANFDLNSAKRNYDLAWLKLSQLLQQNISGEVEEVGPGTAEAADLRALLKQDPDYVKAAKTLEIAELAQKSTISEFLPSISLNGRYSNTGLQWPPDTNTSSWSLNLSYSFFPGGSNIADWAIGAANLDAAKENYAQAANDLLFGLKQTYQGYLNSLDALQLSRISLAANIEREKITTAGYLNGLYTYDEWSRIEQSYFQSQKGELSAEGSALLAEAAWYKSYGGWIK